MLASIVKENRPRNVIEIHALNNYCIAVTDTYTKITKIKATASFQLAQNLCDLGINHEKKKDCILNKIYTQL